MIGKYSSIEEIENSLKSYPILGDFDSLSEEEKGRYLTMLVDVVSSYKVGGPIDYYDLNDLLFPYIEFIGASKDEHFIEKCSKMLAKESQRISSELLQTIKNGLVADEEYCKLVNDYCYPYNENTTYDEIFSLI